MEEAPRLLPRLGARILQHIHDRREHHHQRGPALTRLHRVEHQFVDLIPQELDAGVLYISVEYGVVVHLCCCGCGSKVVTPLHPAQWSVTFDGEWVSLWPSVGSHALPCRSHYVIERSKVRWLPAWSTELADMGRRRDRLALEQHFADGKPAPVRPETSATPVPAWRRLLGQLLRR